MHGATVRNLSYYYTSIYLYISQVPCLRGLPNLKKNVCFLSSRQACFVKESNQTQDLRVISYKHSVLIKTAICSQSNICLDFSKSLDL